MTPTQSADKGYQIVTPNAWEIVLVNNRGIVKSWWAADFGGKLPGLSHPKIQKAIERVENAPGGATGGVKMKTIKQMSAAARLDNPIPQTCERASGSLQPDCSAAGPNSHKCTTCGHVWESIDDKTAKDVRKAAQVNGQGPSCGLCMHLEMAYRYAEAQGYRTFTDAVTQWLNSSKPQNDKLTHKAGAKDV